MKGESTPIEIDLQRRISKRETAEANVGLAITILGDGRDTPEFSKRLELKERLAGSPFVASVTIPEQLHERNPAATPEEVERSAIEAADVVLLLEAPASPPLGGHTEARIYFDRSVPDKWFRVRPIDREDFADNQPLVSGLARDSFLRIETFEYESAEWEGCGRITASCQRRISLMGYREVDKKEAME